MQREPEIQTSTPGDAVPLTLANGPAEAQRVVAAAQEKGLSLRLLGGIAIHLRCPSAKHRALNRTYADLDFVAHKKQAKAIRDVMVENGYTADRRFNALHGERRLLFEDEAHARHVDIFLSVFEMCHKLPLEQRLDLHPVTLSPADLLLTKLQIIQLNAKDIQDTLALLLDFPPMESTLNPGHDLDVGRIAHLCAQDWGWFTTVNDSFDRIAVDAAHLLNTEEAALVVQRIKIIKQALTQAPKSAGWRLRSVAGRRIPWYELPEEIRR